MKPRDRKGVVRMIQKQWNYSSTVHSLAVWLWCHTAGPLTITMSQRVSSQPAPLCKSCSCWNCPQPLNCVWQRKHSPNHNAVPCSGAHQGLPHPFYFSKGCNSFFRGHQSLPVLAPEGRPAHRRADKGKSACSGRGTQHCSTSECFLTFIPPHTETTPKQHPQTHPPVSESKTTSSCCSCMVLLLLTSLRSFSPTTAFIFPVFTRECLDESVSEE